MKLTKSRMLGRGWGEAVLIRSARVQSVIIRDIMDDLQLSQANHAALIESTTDLIWSVDLNHGLQSWNSTLDEHFRKNYGTHAFLGARPEQLVPPGRAESWAPYYQRAVAEGPYLVEYALPDGRCLELAFYPIGHGQEVVGISVFGKDTTARKAAERALRASENKVRDLLDLAPVGCFRCGLDGRLVYSSRGLWRQLGCPSLEAFQAHCPNLNQAWARPERAQAFQTRLLAEGKVEGFELDLLLATGERRPFVLFAYLDGAAAGFMDCFLLPATK